MSKQLQIITILFCILTCQNVFSQSPGSLDAGYGNNGTSVVSVRESGEVNFLQVDNQDRIYLCQTEKFIITRLLPDGTLDASYGIGGSTPQLTGLPASYYVTFHLMQEDQKMVLGAYSNSQRQLLVVRFGTDGQPDASFGTNGIFMNAPDLFAENNLWYDATLDTDGSLFVIGEKEGDLVIEKLTPYGKIDSTYDNDGIVKKTGVAPRIVTMQTDGKVLVGGAWFSNESVYRFKTNGGLDKSFGTDGQTTLNLAGGNETERIIKLLQQPDGKILIVAAWGNPADIGMYTIFITRLNTDGSVDNTFGTNGTTAYQLDRHIFQTNSIFQVLQQSDGKLLLSYWTMDNGLFPVIVRFNTDGLPDNTFNAGVLSTYAVPGFDLGPFVATGIQSTGKIIAGFGYNYDHEGGNVTDDLYSVRLYNDLNPGSGCPLPQSVAISDITDSKATVSWTGNPDAYSYRIRKRPVGTTIWIYSSVLAPVTTKTLSNNIPATDYEVQVQTYCNPEKTDSSGYTSSVFFTSANECSGTTSQSTTNITGTAATLNWTYSIAPAKWAIKYKASGNSFTTVKISGNLSSYVLSGLSAATNYEWKIQAKCGSENSEWSALQHFTTSPGKLADAVNDMPFSIHPNPAKDQITIQFSLLSKTNVNIKVYDVSGKEMVTWFDDQIAEGDQQLSFDVSSFSKGIYFVKLISGNGIQNQKLVIQ